MYTYICINRKAKKKKKEAEMFTSSITSAPFCQCRILLRAKPTKVQQNLRTMELRFH